jgi:hypothetical protein
VGVKPLPLLNVPMGKGLSLESEHFWSSITPLVSLSLVQLALQEEQLSEIILIRCMRQQTRDAMTGACAKVFRVAVV